MRTLRAALGTRNAAKCPRQNRVGRVILTLEASFTASCASITAKGSPFAANGRPNPASRGRFGPWRREIMSSEMSVARVLAKLEARAAVHREQQGFHAQKEAHHREQRELHEAELEKVNANLETFRAAAATAVDLAAQSAVES